MRLGDLDCEYFGTNDPSQPLLVVLHGRGDSSEGFHWLAPQLGLRPLNYLLVNAPDPWYTGYSWYDLPPRQGPGIERSRGMLDRLFEGLVSAGHSPSRLAVLGFSQGCLMTLEWGARSPIELAAYVGISGYCYDAQALARERLPHTQSKRWLVTHGKRDEVLSFRESSQQYQYLIEQGWPLEFHAFEKEHTIDLENELPLIREHLKRTLLSS